MTVNTLLDITVCSEFRIAKNRDNRVVFDSRFNGNDLPFDIATKIVTAISAEDDGIVIWYAD